MLSKFSIDRLADAQMTQQTMSNRKENIIIVTTEKMNSPGSLANSLEAYPITESHPLPSHSSVPSMTVAEVEKSTMAVNEPAEHKHHEGCTHEHEHEHEEAHSSDSETGEELEGDDKILNRNEKKARKLLSKAGLRPVEGIERVTFKRSRTVFAITNPQVFKVGESFIVFGEARMEDSGLQAQAMAAQRLARQIPQQNAGELQEQSSEDKAEDNGKEKIEAEEEKVDSTGVDEKDVRIVMDQTGVSRAKAVNALKENNNDIVNTIMELTM